MKPQTLKHIDILIQRHLELTGSKEDIISALELIVTTFSKGRKLVLCGNGGSSTDCDHIVVELSKAHFKHRQAPADVLDGIAKIAPNDLHFLSQTLEPGFPVISLGSNSSSITAFGNDKNFDVAFANQVLAYGKKGDTFLALRGAQTDGHDFIESAIKNGATKIIAEEGNYSVETEIVKDTREYLSEYLKNKYKDILEKMKIIGITGTNGKTTVAYLTYQALRRLGVKAAYIGTIGFYIEEKLEYSINTTPDIYDLYEMMNQAYNEGCTVFVMEVSSQGIGYGRVKGFEFDMALFTNLTQDHLDYHKTMENYALAKQQLFKQLKDNHPAIVNDDDEYKDYFLLDKNKNITYGYSEGSTYQLLTNDMSLKGTHYTFKYDGKEYKVFTTLYASYNIYNTLGVIILLHEYGFEIEEVIKILPDLLPPDGRLDIVKYKTNSIIVDYAHTPDAFEKLLTAIKEIKENHVYVVFGCDGSRDKLKRPIMANLALDNADYVVITNGGPRDEDPNLIIKDIIRDLTQENYEIIMDRRLAIVKGISLLEDHDLLLILGQGHEEFLQVKDKKIPFKDKDVVLECLDKYFKD